MNGMDYTVFKKKKSFVLHLSFIVNAVNDQDFTVRLLKEKKFFFLYHLS
jgi:hypothetical protein